jgi:hypothetical protein
MRTQLVTAGASHEAEVEQLRELQQQERAKHQQCLADSDLQVRQSAAIPTGCPDVVPNAAALSRPWSAPCAS